MELLHNFRAIVKSSAKDLSPPSLGLIYTNKYVNLLLTRGGRKTNHSELTPNRKQWGAKFWSTNITKVNFHLEKSIHFS